MKTAYDIILEPVISEQSMDVKVKRMGRNVGRTSAYKKAIITLTEKSKEIEFFQGL